MLNFIKKLAALVLLLAMPLQDVAASSLSVLQCPPIAAGAASIANSDDGAAPERGDDATQNFLEHFFCHQLHSAIPVIPATTAMPDLPVFESSISILQSLLFPDQPQRPPFPAGA